MSSSFQAINVVGGVLPPALLGRVQTGSLQDRTGLAPASYFLSGRETIGDAASRSWSYLKGVWQDWQETDARKGGVGPGTGDARQRWLLILLRELGYGQVAQAGSEIENRSTYPVSHLWGNVPIHLLGPRVQLDKRNPGVEGAAKAPQKMLQELLNHSPKHLWAILSNGLKLRLLRDSTALAGSAYIEFDLETIFTSELYSEFQLLWQVCHQSRLAERNAEAGPDSCWLESWRSEAVESGSRALDRLGVGVQRALERFGTGILRHPDNAWLVDALHADDLTRHDFHKALLRTAYRLLFCFVVEDRGVLLVPEASAKARQRYADFFSTRRLRDLSRKHNGGPHSDLWRTQKLVFRALGGDGLDKLGLPALGGLFDPDSRAKLPISQPGPDLVLECELANRDLLRAISSLAWVKNPAGRIEAVDYRHLGAEELGSVYESLLELVPRLDLETKTFELENVAGNERKVSGSYYTPPRLVSALLDTALDPLLDEAVRLASDPSDAEQRLLGLTVCDPASGSGGFLVAAARRMARRLAEVRAGADEPTPNEIRHALHDVVDRCIYGVDMNDLAADLAKVSLWLEAVEPGKPLSFLDARIKIGNSLMGATPALIAAGIPDDAFKPLEGDLKPYASEVRKANKAQSKSKIGQYLEHFGQDALDFGEKRLSFEHLIAGRQRLNRSVASAAEARLLAREFAVFDKSEGLRIRRLEADAWCASFVWPLDGKHPQPPTNSVFRNISTGYQSESLVDTVDEINRLRDEYRFFHWHLEFPEIFGDPASEEDNGLDGWPRGFSCMLGNPPWERVKLQEKEFFASREAAIADAPTAAIRRKLIADLEVDHPTLWDDYVYHRRSSERISHFLRVSYRFPFCGHGDVNTYAVFAELMVGLISKQGLTGFIVKTGLFTDDTYKRLPAYLLEASRLRSMYDFENRFRNSTSGLSALFFENVHSAEKFCLVTVGGGERIFDETSIAFFVQDAERPNANAFKLSPERLRAINPRSNTLPVFRTQLDAEITASVYERLPILHPEHGSGWTGLQPYRMFDVTNASHLFRTSADMIASGFVRTAAGDFTDGAEHALRLFEGKMVDIWDHRNADVVWSDGASHRQRQPRYLTVTEKSDADRLAIPAYWVLERDFHVAPNAWEIGFSLVTSVTNKRTFLASPIPRSAMASSVPMLRTGLPAAQKLALLSLLSSLVFDYVARQKVGGVNMSFFIVEQLPIPPLDKILETASWDSEQTILDWLNVRAIELVYVSTDMGGFASELQVVGEPFVWCDARRMQLQCELNAAVLHLYGINRKEAEHILDTFAIVNRGDQQTFGEARSKRLILENFDALNKAIETGIPFASSILPDPGHGKRHVAKGLSQ